MKICFIADANSIHARRWIEYFCKPENEIFILSTVKNPEPIAGADIYDLHSGKVVAPISECIATKNKGASRPLLGGTPDNKMGNYIIWTMKKFYENGFIARA